MESLQYWQEKIQERRKATPFREFVRDVASWYTANIYKVGGVFTRYPATQNTPRIITVKEYEENEQASISYD
jgi:hypothetical protein